MSSLDIEGFPHILQSISSYSDSSTLASLLRVSSLASSFALPILYPKTHLFDPFPPIKRAQTTLHHILPLEWSNQLPKKTAKAKITSFLSSPHLARVKQIVIRRPDILAGRVARLAKAPEPAIRGEGTVTAIWVEPWRLKWGCLTGGVSGRTVVVKERDGVDEEEYEADNGHPLPHFLHIFDVANLIPSEHLVLYVPPTADIDFRALCEVAYKYQRPVGVRHLTLIFGDGFARIARYEGIYSSVPENHFLSPVHTPWYKIEMVLLPRTYDSNPKPPKKVTVGHMVPSYLNRCKAPVHFAYIGDYTVSGGIDGVLQDGERCDGLVWRLKGIDEWREDGAGEAFSWLDWEWGFGGQQKGKAKLMQDKVKDKEDNWTSE